MGNNDLRSSSSLKLQKIEIRCSTVNGRASNKIHLIAYRIILHFKGSVHEKSSRVIWPSTYPYRWEIMTLGPALALNSRKLRFVAQPSTVEQATKYIYRSHFLLFHRFRCFTWCQPVMVDRLNYIHWLAIPPGVRIRRNDHFLLLKRSTNWLVDHSRTF